MPFMPRPRKPFVQREVTRHGKTIWYFRRGKEKRIRLPGVFGSPEFNAAYDRAMSGDPAPVVAKPAKTTLRWLVDRYYESGRFEHLKSNTKRNRRLMLESTCKNGSQMDFREIDPSEIRKGLMRREGTPTMAQTYLTVMKALFEFAVDSGYIEESPVLPTIKARAVKSDGYHTWTVEEIERYQKRHPVGTQARLALDIMLYTGLRRSDAIIFGRQHIKGSVIQIRAGKNGAEITIPLLPPLAASIAATDIGDMIFLKNARGQPWKNISFGYWFADRCDEAGVPGRAHGLRKAGATIAANNGATAFDLTAMYGWSSIKMAEVYTKKADRVRLAERAANKLFPNLNPSIPAPSSETAENKASGKRR